MSMTQADVKAGEHILATFRHKKKEGKFDGYNKN